MHSAFYLFVDGMSESLAEHASLAQARTPTMDAVAQCGRMGFYLPVISSHHTEPKTDIVIPAFFGLAPTLNPGRAALELCDQDIPIRPGEWYCSLKLQRPSERSTDWRSATVLDSDARAAIVGRVTGLCERRGVLVRRSEATQYGERLLLGATSKEACETAIVDVEETVRAYDLTVIVQDLQKVPAKIADIRASQPRLLFLGWAKGSLRGAFKFLGAHCNPFTREASRLYDWETYEADFDRWSRPLLEAARDSYETIVLYTKQAAIASRRGERQRKIGVIEWVDWMMVRVLAYLDPGTVVIALSDHSADLEGYTNPPVNTCFALARWDPGNVPTSEPLHFCESAILRCGHPVLTQEELMRSIDELRS